MKRNEKVKEKIGVENAPDIPGLTFRGFRGEEDYPHMANIINATKLVDQIEWTTSVESISRDYANLVRCDLYQDMLFAEIGGKVIAYSRCTWYEEFNGDHIYFHFVHLKPSWRFKGLG